MSGARTEQPTPRRLREARRRGDVAVSRELSGAAALAGGLAGLAVAGPGITRDLARGLRHALERAAAGAELTPLAAVETAIAAVLRATLPVAGAALVGGALAAALQAGFGISPAVLAPRLDRIDPLRGARRLFSAGQLLQALLALGKAAVILWVLAAWLGEAARSLAGLPRLDAAALWRALPLLSALALRLVVTFGVFGVLDLALARRRHLRALRMTKDEVRREQKEDDGDPRHKAERRRVHRALVEAGTVARATVVVVNPTHVAVALRHEKDGDEAPRIVAKGTGLAAARIRSSARRAGVPIVRDVPLARALHRLAEVGDEIPEELYEAAAAVLAHLYGTRGAP